MMKQYSKISAIAMTAAMALGCASPPQPAPTESVPSAAAQEQAQQSASNQTIQALGDMEALRGELAELRNEVEIQRHELDKLQRRQRQLYDDLDYRLRERERGAAAPSVGYRAPSVAPAPAPAYPGSPGLGAQQDAARGTVTPAYGQAPTAQSRGELPPSAALRPGVGQQSPGVPTAVTPGYPEPQTGVGQRATAPPPGAVTPPPVAPPAQTVTVVSAEEQAAYDGAFELLKQSRYGEAVDAFRGVVMQFPNGALADDAQYWVGEAMYVTRDFPGALDAFRTVVERFPASPRVPEALLKIGYVQYEMGNVPQAQMTFNEVIARFPGSRVAISAQTRLRKIEQGG